MTGTERNALPCEAVQGLGHIGEQLQVYLAEGRDAVLPLAPFHPLVTASVLYREKGAHGLGHLR